MEQYLAAKYAIDHAYDKVGLLLNEERLKLTTMTTN
jgi:hypothetical protein